MSTDMHHTGKANRGDYIVRSPRPTDALGHALRGVFSDPQLPEEFLVLLRRLERVTH